MFAFAWQAFEALFATHFVWPPALALSAQIACRAAPPSHCLEAVLVALQKWRVDFEARLRQHVKIGVVKLEAGVARRAGHLQAFSESASQNEAEVVYDAEAELRKVHAKVIAVTGKHGPAMAVVDTEGRVAAVLQEADLAMHKAKMMQVGWGLAELCRRPKVADPVKGKKIRVGLHQLYKDALEPAATIEFISADTLAQTVRYIKLDHRKVGMLKNVRDAATRDAVMAAINEPLAVAASNVGAEREGKAWQEARSWQGRRRVGQ